MTSSYFEKPDVEIPEDALLAFIAGRNERLRLPFFLEYYRSHGVDKFFFVDNNSDDGTSEYLRAQDDVVVFWTDTSYVDSKSGRLWTTELANHYGNGHWCLTLDVDEQLVFPGAELVTIKELTGYLNSHGYHGLFCFFLDMYGDKSVLETEYQEGTPFLDTCPYYDAQGYQLRQSERFPFLQIFGGPRQRIFWESGGAGKGPSMRKIPLVKWHEGMDYIFSTHSLTPLRLADITGALLHFKFFSVFAELAQKEVARGDRTQMADYKKYAEKLSRTESVSFMGKNSEKYINSLSLLKSGYITSSVNHTRFCEMIIRNSASKERAHVFWRMANPKKGQYAQTTTPDAQYISQIWPILKNFEKLKQINVEKKIYENLDFDGICLKIEFTRIVNNVIYLKTERLGDSIEKIETKIRVYLGNLVLKSKKVEFQAGNDTIYFKCKIPGFLMNTGIKNISARFIDKRFSVIQSSTKYDTTNHCSTKSIDGVCEWIRGGEVRGWVVDNSDPNRELDIDIYVDDAIVATVSATIFRKDIARARDSNGLHGFSHRLNKAHYEDGCVVRLRVRGTAVELRKSPVSVSPSGTGSEKTKGPKYLPAGLRKFYSIKKGIFGSQTKFKYQ